MDHLEEYRSILQDELESRASTTVCNATDYQHQLIVDKDRNYFLLLFIGWVNKKYKCYPIYHFEIKGDKVWVHQDNTDVGIAEVIANRGIPKSSIVLGYFPEYAREFSDYAVA